MAQLEIKNLTFSYPMNERKQLKNVTFSVQPGEFVLLCGKSGSGKTTLLRQLKTILAPHGVKSGEILFEGKPMEQWSEKQQAMKIGYVMQNPESQMVTDKVWHELAFGLENLGTSQEKMQLRIAEVANYFGIQNWFAKDTDTLSGGQKQLLHVASVMVMQPDILILDEPTSQLDPIAATAFLNTLKRIQEEIGTTILMTEHRTQEVFALADKVLVLDEGELVANGTPREVAKQLYIQKHPVMTELPVATRVYMEASGKEECPLTVREGRLWLTSAIANRKGAKEKTELEENYFPKQTDIIIEGKHLWMRYEKEEEDVLKDLSFQIPKGSFVAIMGGNGSGKSTLLKVICGVVRPYEGKIIFQGKDIRKYKKGSLFKEGMAMLPQDPASLFVKSTVKDELQEMCKDQEKIGEIVEICEIQRLLENHPFDLSSGEQQRVALAKVLLTGPKVLLLDEPTKGMDGFYKEKLARVLEQLKEQGITVVMVSHDVEFCGEYPDYVCLCFDGKLLAKGTPKQFFSENSFYTTAASRMSRGIMAEVVTAKDIVKQLEGNGSVQ